MSRASFTGDIIERTTAGEAMMLSLDKSLDASSLGLDLMQDLVGHL